MDRARGLAVSAGVLGALGLALLIASLAWLRTGYLLATVPGESMSPTYALGDRVVAERIGGDEVRRGEVVLYSAPERYPGLPDVMHRVIGVSGDHVVCCVGLGTARERITVNGKPLDEPYVKGGMGDGTHHPYDVKVPDGRMFVLGDRRSNARDSRAFPDDHGGTVPVGAVRGRVTDAYAVPVLLAAATLFGLVLVLTGFGAARAARTERRLPAAARLSLWPDHL